MKKIPLINIVVFILFASNLFLFYRIGRISSQCERNNSSTYKAAKELFLMQNDRIFESANEQDNKTSEMGLEMSSIDVRLMDVEMRVSKHKKVMKEILDSLGSKNMISQRTVRNFESPF